MSSGTVNGNPVILGLGELNLNDQERNHLGAGGLDLLFQDPDSNLRYEGESHQLLTRRYFLIFVTFI
jgi:hypothetical protein